MADLRMAGGVWLTAMLCSTQAPGLAFRDPARDKETRLGWLPFPFSGCLRASEIAAEIADTDVFTNPFKVPRQPSNGSSNDPSNDPSLCFAEIFQQSHLGAQSGRSKGEDISIIS